MSTQSRKRQRAQQHYVQRKNAIESGNMSKSAKTMAKFANAAYQDNEGRQDIHADWVYVPEHSSEHHAVYVNEGKKEVITSFRGTKIDDVKDIQSDAAIIAHRHHLGIRFVEGAEHFENITNHYKADEYDHILTGHSLGGTIAKHLEKKYDEVGEVHSFNAGTASPNIAYLFEAEKKHVNEYFIAGDPISAMGTVLNNNNVEIYEHDPKLGNAHSIKQFL